MDEYKVLHRGIRRLAHWAVVSFFTRVHVIGGENVPEDGPLIVTATHHNMMLDPAVLSSAFPHQRILNYWSKATLFKNPVMKFILLSTGNIPVERKSHDRRVLFKGTFDALAKGWAVALFPEGTSYTEPRIMQVKDGAAWSALEYTKWAKENPDKVSKKPVMIIPAAIVYTNKSKYRSDVILEFGRPISMDEYEAQFMDETEGSARAAVKRLTGKIYHELVQATVNAPDWDTMFVARMARDLLWEDDTAVPLDDFVAISQTLVDLFSTPDVTPNVTSVRRYLLSYYSLLQSTNLTNSVLSSLPLSSTLDPSKRTPITLRLRTLAILTRDTVSSLVRLPFFLFPLVMHTPVYVMSRLGGRLVEEEEETQAQNKVVLGLLMMVMIYPAAFFFLWALLWFSPIGALLAASTMYLFAMYHNRLINDNYMHLKRLIAAWRVLIGVWTPKRFDLPLAALSQYTTPLTPPENPWVERPREPAPSTEHPSSPDSATNPTGNPASLSAHDGKPDVKRLAAAAKESVRKHRAPTRRVIRHVLRARGEAARALSSFFAQLEKDAGAGASTRWVCASVHLARLHGGRVEDIPEGPIPVQEGVAGVKETQRGWRSAREVIGYLRTRGAKIATLQRQIEGGWGALSSGEQTPAEEQEEPVWVPPGRH